MGLRCVVLVMARDRAILALLVTAVLSASAPTSRACGLCKGDKVAAVYDGLIIQKALAEGKAVEFAGVEGVFAESDKPTLKKAIVSVKGIDADTIRISVMPASVSFAFTPKVGHALDMLLVINKKLANTRLSVMHIKTEGNDATRK